MRNQILIVDDEELNRELLRQIFEDSYEIIMAEDGEQALAQFMAHRESIAAVLLDLVMPRLNGYEVLLKLYEERDIETIPVIMITANTDTNTALECYSIGAAEIIGKPFVAEIVKRRVISSIELYASREKLQNKLEISESNLKESENKLEQFNVNLIDAISDMVEFRDMESGQHVKRVKALTGIMAQAYSKLHPESNLTPAKIDTIVKAAALHDIGKLAIPDAILLKPGRLTNEEFAIMKTHTTKGCELLKKLKNVQDEEMYQVAYEIVRHHHERYDGRGYPDALKGDEIPLSAELVSIVDVYDALTSERCYKKAFDKETAHKMILNGECGTFSPKLLDCFDHAREEIEAYSAD